MQLDDDFINGDWHTNWEIDPAGNLTPTAYTENGKTDLILFNIPKGSKTGKDGTNKIRIKTGDSLSYGIYESRFKLKDVNFQNSTTGVYVGMGLWNFNGPTQQEVMMGFYYDPGAHDYLQLLTTKNRPRDGSSDPTHKYHSKIVDTNVTLKDFTTYRTIKFDYQPDKILGYLDDKLVLTKTSLIPSEKMTLVIGCRVTGGTLSSPMNVIWDYVKINVVSNKYRCSGAPDFLCVEDPSGQFNSLAECQAACKPSEKKFDVYAIGDPANPNGVLAVKTTPGNYTTDEACKAACDVLKKII